LSILQIQNHSNAHKINLSMTEVVSINWKISWTLSIGLIIQNLMVIGKIKISENSKMDIRMVFIDMLLLLILMLDG